MNDENVMRMRQPKRGVQTCNDHEYAMKHSSTAPLHCRSWLTPLRLGVQRGALNTVNPTVHSRVSHRIEEESIMHMLDWNKYRQQLVTGVGGLGKLNPDIVKGYTALSRASQKASPR